VCDVAEDPGHTVLKCSETKLWSEICIKNKWGHFGNDTHTMKIEITKTENQ
jgi:hypothetical protein